METAKRKRGRPKRGEVSAKREIPSADENRILTRKRRLQTDEPIEEEDAKRPKVPPARDSDDEEAAAFGELSVVRRGSDDSSDEETAKRAIEELKRDVEKRIGLNVTHYGSEESSDEAEKKSTVVIKETVYRPNEPEVRSASTSGLNVTFYASEDEPNEDVTDAVEQRHRVTIEEKLEEMALKRTSERVEANPPRRRVIKKKEKKPRAGNLRKKPKPNDERYEVTKELTTDDLNRIQITISTKEKNDLRKGFAHELKEEMLKKYYDAGKMTYRVMKRANFIIETVRQEKVIVDLTKLMRLIKEEEANEGYKAVMDKKSLMRLIMKLTQDGYVIFRKATMRSDAKEKTVNFICDPDIQDDHSVILSALEQFKMKFFIVPKRPTKETDTNFCNIPDLATVDGDATRRFDDFVGETLQEDSQFLMKYRYDRNSGKKYGLCPKFIRTRVMHLLLYHMIYEQKPPPVTDRAEIGRLMEGLGVAGDIFDGDQFSPLYHREADWRMFIPPLPAHGGWPLGWTIISDVLVRMPIAIFFKCFNVPYAIPDIRRYLDHPVKKYFLVKNLPPRIRNGLLHGRRYIFSMHEIATRLCHMGLLQFGPQKLKEKDQVFVYLNRRCSMYNTITSAAGYHQVEDVEYERTEYSFADRRDVERYWYELWSTCVNTNLGSRNHVAGQTIVLEQANTKPKLIEACRQRGADQATSLDTGEIPGDRRGAAGLDSALFAHLKRNWNWSDLFACSGTQPAVRKDDVVVDEKPPAKAKRCPEPAKNVKPKRHAAVKKRESQRTRIVRHVQPTARKTKKPHYDEKDKISLKRMSKLRTDWTQIEDNVLLLCTVAQIYLCPNRRRQCVECTITRDVLHKVVPYAKDKTSRSCQRRVNYIMKNFKTRRSVQMCLEEIRQCEFVAEKFGGALKRFQNAVVPTDTLNVAFVELVAYMNRRFSSQIPTTSRHPSELPDTVEEVRKSYDFSVRGRRPSGPFRDVETKDDVDADVVRSIIHSSLCSVKDKTNWAFQLFKIYSTYPERILRSVIARMRHEQMVSMKKSFVKTGGNLGCMPLSSSPFQLSISYTYQLQSAKCSYETYGEANAFLRSLLDWSGGGGGDDFEIRLADNGTCMLILDVMDKLALDFKFEHPEQVIILDPCITDDTAYERIVDRYNEILRDPTKIKFWEEKRVDDDDNYPELECEPTAIPRSSTRIAFHMMRAEMCEGVDKNSAQHIHDYFVVNASRVFMARPVGNRPRVDVAELQRELLMTRTLETIKNDIVVPEHCGKLTTADVREYFSNRTLKNQDFEYVEKVKCRIIEADMLGLTNDELRLIRSDADDVALTAVDVVTLLLHLKVVFRVGTTAARYVHFEHMRCWIVSSKKVVRLEREKMIASENFRRWKGKTFASSNEENATQRIQLLMAPWVRLDGGLNRRVLDRWLGSVLTYCVEEPGISLEDLTKRYDYVKPLEVLFLVETLDRIGCVALIKLRKPKVSLFSTEPDFDFVEATPFDDQKFIIVEPSEDAIYKFAVFLGNKTYAANFIK